MPLLALACARGREREDYTGALGRLAIVLDGYRVVEPRLTGLQPAPCAHPGPLPPAPDDLVPEPDCAGGRLPSPRDLTRALRDLEAAKAGFEPLPAARAAVLIELVGKRSPAGLRRAIEDLEREAKRAGPTASADVWSDLAAARLVLAQRADEPIELLNALEAADEALARDERHPGARFNRALALEYFGLTGLARQAWNDYRELDTDPLSVTEADARLTRIEEELRRATRRAKVAERLEKAVRQGDVTAGRELVQREPARARRLLEREILPAWGRAVLGGDMAGAGRILGTMRSMVEAQRAIDGDMLFTQTLATIDTVIADPERLQALASGHASFGYGMTLYDDRRGRRPELAEKEFSRSFTALSAAHSPAAHLSALYVAICEYLQSRPGYATARLTSIEHYPDLDRSPSLSGRVHWQLALIDGNRGERARAIEHLAVASKTFAQVRDAESLAAVEDLTAGAYEMLGDHPQGWRHRWMALRSLPSIADPGRRWVIVKAAGENLYEHGRQSPAAAFFEELVMISGQNSELRAQALLRRAQVHASRGLASLAERDYREAEAAIARLVSPELQARIEVDFLVAQATALASSNPERALRLLEEPGKFYHRAGNLLLSSRVLLARSRAAIAAGREPAAERWLDQALVLAEQEWSRLRDSSLRTTFLEELRSTFDQLILCQYRTDPDLAFATVERARARVLLDYLGNRPLTQSQVRETLAPGVVLVEYAEIGDRLLVWVLRRGDRHTISKASAAGAVRELAEAIARESDEVTLQRHLAALYDVLVRPVASVLPAGGSVVFIPDGRLGAVPFAALLDRETGRFLIEGHKVIVAPSASVHVAAQRRARDLQRPARHSVLAIGDPAFDRQWHPSLSRLPEAAREALSIFDLYPSGKLLLDSDATPTALRAAVPGHDVLHLATHAVADIEVPGRSALVLASDGTEPSSGDLTTAALEDLPLSSTFLVVLASCDAATGRATAGEGMLSLARAALIAGAASVTAPLWEIKDRETTDIFLDLHRQVAAGREPSEALRHAQLTALASLDPDQRSPRSWGAFQLFGAAGTKY